MAIPTKVDNMLNQIINAKESKLDSIVWDLNKALLDISEEELREAHQKVLENINNKNIKYKFNENLIRWVLDARLEDYGGGKPITVEKKEKKNKQKVKEEVSSGIESTEELEKKPKSKEEILEMRKEVKEMEEELNVEIWNLKKEPKGKKEGENKDDEITYTLDEEESKPKKKKSHKEEILEMREEIRKMEEELKTETWDLKIESEESPKVEDKEDSKEKEKRIKKKRKILWRLRARFKKKEKEIKDDIKEEPKIEKVKAEGAVKEEESTKKASKVEEVKIEPNKEIVKPVEKLEIIASLDTKEIEDAIRNILKAQGVVKAIWKLELTWYGEKFKIDTEITVKRGIKINTYITWALVNTDDNIVFSEYDIDADILTKKIKSMLEKDLWSLWEKIKAYFEMDYWQEIKKIQIEDNKLNIYTIPVKKEPVSLEDDSDKSKKPETIKIIEHTEQEIETGDEALYQLAKDLSLFENKKDNIEIDTKTRKKGYQDKVIFFHKERWKKLSKKDAEEYKKNMLKTWDLVLDTLVSDKELILKKEYVDAHDYNNKPDLKVIKSDQINIRGHNINIERVQAGKEKPLKQKWKTYDEGFIKKSIKEIEVEDKELLPSRTTSQYQHPAIKIWDMLKVQKQGEINKTKLLVWQNWQVAEQDKTKTDNIVLGLYKLTWTWNLKIFRSQDKKISISKSDYENIFKVRIEWDW